MRVEFIEKIKSQNLLSFRDKYIKDAQLKEVENPELKFMN